jgi:hypothetical protein
MNRATQFAALFGFLFVAACSSATTPTDEPTKSSDRTSKSDKTTDTNPTEPTDSNSEDGDQTSGPSKPAEPTSSGKDLGGICLKDGDCASELCVFKGDSPRGVCTKQCNNVTDCPGGYTAWDDCAEVQNVTGKVCIPKT